MRLLQRGDAIKKSRHWLLIGEAEAWRCSPILLPIIEACRSRGTDPQGYLREVLTRLPPVGGCVSGEPRYIGPEAQRWFASALRSGDVALLDVMIEIGQEGVIRDRTW
jgi:hypothetical protein